ncbi:hypothetical protein RSAG8_06293, partial [Rhizoctonia solani AG-8 WAC10335]
MDRRRAGLCEHIKPSFHSIVGSSGEALPVDKIHHYMHGAAASSTLRPAPPSQSEPERSRALLNLRGSVGQRRVPIMPCFNNAMCRERSADRPGRVMLWGSHGAVHWSAETYICISLVVCDSSPIDTRRVRVGLCRCEVESRSQPKENRRKRYYLVERAADFGLCLSNPDPRSGSSPIASFSPWVPTTCIFPESGLVAFSTSFIYPFSGSSHWSPHLELSRSALTCF